ncbi:hypothetical protein [Acinetobacter sp. c1-l78]|uniref:hypothetical protein n=1 Tax=Acinetobacter sp. c1-l78 TaxID=3342803 RepID=UPI0035B7BE39
MGYYSSKRIKQEDPYLLKKDNFQRPDKEKLNKLLDELTNYNHNYYKDFYINKGGIGNIYIRRSFRHDNRNQIFNNIKQKNLIILKERELYCDNEIAINLNSGTDNGEQYFSIAASWSYDNKCREYLLGGLHPRALQNSQVQ